jgi:Uma2 family endonuclease
MSVASTITTAEQLFKAGDIGRCELVRGELVMMSPSGPNHGQIANELAFVLTSFVKRHRLGRVCSAETGFMIRRNPDTVLAPDVAFIRAGRGQQMPKQGYFPGPPDLAVEVLSPNDTAGEVLAKTQAWLAAGAVAVWIADPERKTIAIHRRDQAAKVFGEQDQVAAGEPLAGLVFAVGEIFA